jgi:hypothetical protein
MAPVKRSQSKRSEIRSFRLDAALVAKLKEESAKQRRTQTVLVDAALRAMLGLGGAR